MKADSTHITQKTKKTNKNNNSECAECRGLPRRKTFLPRYYYQVDTRRCYIIYTLTLGMATQKFYAHNSTHACAST